jgi:hypothetical protein
MADISKCNNRLCRRKDTCYRWVAPASELQLYLKMSEKKKEERKNGCELYWEARK